MRNFIRLKARAPKYFVQDVEDEFGKNGMRRETTRQVLESEQLDSSAQVDPWRIDSLVEKVLELEEKQEDLNARRQRQRLNGPRLLNVSEWEELNLYLERLEKFSTNFQKRIEILTEN